MEDEQSNGILALTEDIKGGEIKGRFTSPHGDVKILYFTDENDVVRFARDNNLEVRDARNTSTERE